MAELTDDVIDTIIAESVGDGVPGMTAVGWAIANRAAKGNTSPDAVVKKPKQFDGYSNPGKGVRAAQNDPRIRAQVKEIWGGIENRTIPDPLQGGTMFHASSMTPYWSDAENKHGTVRIGNQTYYKGGHALPPGELPAVGTLTDTVPPRAVAPVTPSIDLAQMRRTNIPSQLMPDTFASLASGRTNSQTRAADLGLTEKTAATPYLKRNGDVLDPAGVVFGKEMVTQLPGTRKAVPQSTIERTALPRFSPDYISQSRQRVASTNPTLLPPIPPSTLGQPPAERVVQSVPVTPPPAPKPLPRVTVTTPYNLQQHLVGQDAGNVPRALPAPTQTAFVPEARYIEPRNVPAPSYAGPFVPDKGLERLASPAGLPVADTQLARLVAPMPAIRPATFAPAVPAPMPPYNDVGTDLAIRPMPSLPRVRPSFIQQRPVVAQQRAPLRITVSGAQVRRPVAAQPLPAAPALSKAQLYALLTANRSGSNSDAANRVNGSNTRGSGGARSLLD